MHKAATIIAGLGLAVASVVVHNTASATQPNPNHKDWVCKYVGKPGVNERFSHLIWVDTAATQGQWFNDGQNSSFVLLANAPHEPKPDASQCPSPVILPTEPPAPTPPVDTPTEEPTDTPTDTPTGTPTDIGAPPTVQPSTPGTTVEGPKQQTPKHSPKHAHVPAALPETGA